MRSSLRLSSLAIGFFLLAVSTIALTNCAKVPSDASSIIPSRFVDITMTLRGPVNPNYYYFVLIGRTDKIGDPGPVPVVAPPWGNGFAAASQSDAQGFVAAVFYSNSGGLSGYEVYKVPTDANNVPAAKPYQIGTGLTGFISLGQPDQVTAIRTGDHTLRFRVDLSRLPNATAPYLQVNFLATDNLPAGVDSDSRKMWDALGDGSGTSGISSLNTWATIPVARGGRVDNSNLLEPQNDVRDHLGPLRDEPSLDIVDCSIEVLGN